MELDCTHVRWFYADNGSFCPFNSYDTLRLERTNRDGSGTSVLVRNGMFIVTLKTRRCCPIYDQGSDVQVVRGTWFYCPDSQPVPEWLAERIEAQSHKLEGQVEYPFVLELDEYTVTWNPSVVLTSKSPTLVKSLMQTIGLSEPSSVIFRGYPRKAKEGKTVKPISDVIFIIPGIAQSVDKTNASLCSKRIGHLIKKKSKNIELIPINWRSIELGERTLEAIMPQANVRLRDFLNNSLLDVLYYSSPHFRSRIISKLADELSRLYSLFLHYHQGVDPPKVSIIAHSLGSVIFYDFITSHFAVSLPPNFKLRNIFMIGSPLAVFLMLRGFDIRDSSTMEDILPNCPGIRLFNVFFPSDFMAYRLEPMFWRKYRHVQPVNMSTSSHSSSSLTISMFENTEEEETPWYRKWTRFSSFSGISSVFLDWSDSAEVTTPPNDFSDGLEYRLDFALSENNLYFHRLLTSHLCYWDNYEFASFIVRHTTCDL